MTKGKKNLVRASDAAYGLAAQLLAAMANQKAGAGVCGAAHDAIGDGQELLAAIGFTGTGGYFDKGVDELLGTDGVYYTKEYANELAGILDSYNNGTLCAP